MLFPIFNIHPVVDVLLLLGAFIIPYVICKIRKIRSSVAWGSVLITIGVECIIAQQVSYHSTYGYIEGASATLIGVGYLILGTWVIRMKTKKPNKSSDPT